MSELAFCRCKAILAATAVSVVVACGGNTDRDHVDDAREQSRILWSFGDENTLVVSAPSQGPSGTLYLVAYITSDPDELQHAIDAWQSLQLSDASFLVDGNSVPEGFPVVENSRVLVALSPSGEELWRRELVPTDVRPAGSVVQTGSRLVVRGDLGWLPRPIVASDGSVWASAMSNPWDPGATEPADLAGECFVPASGNARCIPGSLWGKSLGDEQMLVGTRLVSDYAAELVALSADASVRWQTVYEDYSSWPCGDFDCLRPIVAFLQSTVSTGDAFYGWCKGCFGDELTITNLARFDLASGIPSQVALDLDEIPRGDFALDENGTIYPPSANCAVAAISPEGTARPESSFDLPCEVASTSLDAPAIGERGLVWAAQRIVSGETVLELRVGAADPTELWLSASLASHDLVLASPGVALLRTSPDGAPANDGAGIVAVDYDGNLVWQYEGTPLEASQPVLPGDGVIYAVTTSRTVVAIEAPVQGVDPGPWPMPGGNPANTRRGR